MEKELMDPALYADRHQKLMGSIWGLDPSSAQVLWKYIK